MSSSLSVLNAPPLQPGDIITSDQWWDGELVQLPLWCVADPDELDDESKKIHKIENFQPHHVGVVLSKHKTYILVMITQEESQGRWGWCDESQVRRL